MTRVALPVATTPREGAPSRGARTRWWLRTGLPVTAIIGVATFMRFWQLAAIGFNSDEAVYAGTAAAIAGDDTLRAMFPVFRAHPLLFQTIVSLGFHTGVSDWTARAFPAAFGVATVGLGYLLGTRLYGRPTGLVGALLLAVMPYHVVVTRQVLLDGLMTLCVTGVLYCVVRYAETVALRWLLAAGVLMGASVLSKETSVVFLGSLYAFFALTPVVRMRARHLLLAALGTAAMVAVVPAVLAGAGRVGTGQHYLLWQLFRRPNHEVIFYAGVVPAAIGPVVLVAAVAGLVWLRRENTWRERLLVCWLAVPVAFFTMWPVKGYQYLLPVAPVIAVLAGRTLVRLPSLPRRLRLPGSPRATVVGAVVLTVASLAVPAWTHVNPRPSDRFLAGTGGLPGGREAGEWVRRHVPRGAKLLAIGPSMANVLQFYGERHAQALSVSANPRERNPSYVPVPNPDRALRDGEFQYVVWDTYTAHRSPFFADKARRLVDRYHGVAVFTSTVGSRPVIVIYQVRAS